MVLAAFDPIADTDRTDVPQCRFLFILFRAYLAHPTGQAQRQIRMSGSRSIESFRCSWMAALGFVGGVSSLLDAAGPSLRPSERGAHSRQRSAARSEARRVGKEGG